MKPFRRLQTEDRKLMAIQEAVGQSLNPVLKVPHLDGVLLTDIDLTTSGATVAHTLGRQPLGWFIVDKTANVDVWRTDWDSRLLTLDASGVVTISLWVF